jgi:mutator protein MutT
MSDSIPRQSPPKLHHGDRVAIVSPSCPSTEVLPEVHAIITAVLIKDRKILLCLRTKERDWFPGVWDFPGGHVGPGETAPAALVREIGEELAIVISEPIGEPDYCISTSEFDMKLWIIDIWEGEPFNAAPIEHEKIGWFTERETKTLRLAHERYPAIIEETLRRTL